MTGWLAEVTNNPDDDYNLIIEILKDDEYVGRIQKINNELIFYIYENKNGINIPVDWLIKILDKAKTDLQ